VPTGGFSSFKLERLIARQLGRSPSISFEVAVKCEYGWPAVIRNSPVNANGGPNPNLYYLTCPWLRRRLARLEDADYIDEMQHLMRIDNKLHSDTLRAQKQHAAEFREARAACGAGQTSDETWIAGARKPDLLKCLHAHMAYFLVHDDYILGSRIAGTVGRLWCRDGRCAAWI